MNDRWDRLAEVTANGDVIDFGSQGWAIDYASQRWAVKKALDELLSTSKFAPVENSEGPYKLDLSIDSGSLVFRTSDCHGQLLPTVTMRLAPIEQLIIDYITHSADYDIIIEGRASLSKIEQASDHKTWLHNKGAEEVLICFSDKIEIDFETGRNIFTLVALIGWKDCA